MSASTAANVFNGFGEAAVAAPPLRRTIPFDYAFRYDLTGQRNFVQNSTVAVSIEASFTAVSIGYGVVPKVSPITFGIPPTLAPVFVVDPTTNTFVATTPKSLFDEVSGREFQSEPILNIAGLGSPEGRRPFRYFARPIEFAPRSAIRMQITEVSEFQGELHISLQGFKTLGASGTPTGARPARRIRRVGR